MLYDVTLSVRYAYALSAAAARMHLRMMPGNGPAQRLVSGLLQADPAPAFRRDRVDFFGNALTEMAYDAPLDTVDFRFTGRIRRDDLPKELDLSCALADMRRELAEVPSLAPDAPHHFLGASDRVVPVPSITAFSRGITRLDQPVLTVVEAISRALHEEITFDPTATDVTTDPATAFANRRGVCQDISHIMIAALRGIGIPAGYVSGFLRTEPPEGQPRLAGADAMHAWVRAWCGNEVGWIEIDPTNDMRVGADHISVAIGRDYADVAPVKGSLRSSGFHSTRHSVDVIPVEERTPVEAVGRSSTD
ncbi:Transglutaminase-like enzyme, putative cysteine protease [Mameliella alba]|uniref:transglutaminase family protein n=1 Tax=Mameliella alba TaxID=561184 RepID=UPI0008829499|nr:transglutaminase family protein [Mameliella alba]OWV49444.1 transglutaminase [Mameliella alba]PTR41410.1 transglutaminase-like putative cysteine protease [Mameliella alba]GGF51250.1 transglutaminase [Mameliella alba]SDC43214.1 Transglutaminase-like enzyme, putative cysteine protease [Mameliella alba]